MRALTPLMRVNDSVADLLRHKLGCSMDALYTRLTTGLPEGTIVALDPLDHDPTRSFSVNLNYRNAWTAGESFNFYRTINLDTGVAVHSDGNVSDRLRNHGIARTLNNTLMGLYEELGIHTVKLTAVQVGVYAWGRMGFVPTQKDWDEMRVEISKRLDYLEAYPPHEDPLSVQCVSLLRHALAQEDPKNFWLIVDQETTCNGDPLGKVLTLEEGFLKGQYNDELNDICVGWVGRFNMKDPDCLMRLSPDGSLHAKAVPAAAMKRAGPA